MAIENTISQPTRLWRHQNFLMLWSARTVSIFGSQLASMAYPLTAVIVLQASPLQMGLLSAASSASAVLVGLFAGVVVDRASRKALLIFTDLGRCLLCVSITLTFIFGILRIELLYVVNFLSGALMIVSEVAGMSFLPFLLGKEQLVEGNSKFAATDSAATAAGPGMSGALVQTLTAPFAILVDAVSFALSAFFVWRIGISETKLPREEKRQSVLTDISEGLRFVFGNALLRTLSQAITLHFFFALIISTLFTLYVIRELHLSPLLLGAIFSAMGCGFFVGAVAAKRITKNFGLGRTMIGAKLLNAIAVFLIPTASGTTFFITIILMIAHFLLAFGIQIHGINLMSLRQAITPNRLQGRMNASFRFVNVCAMMFGALTAGALGENLGLRTTLFIGACGMLLPFFRLLFSPVKGLIEHSGEIVTV